MKGSTLGYTTQVVHPGVTNHHAYPGKSGAEMRAAEEAARDAQPMVQRCGLCPGWEFEGRADDARVAFATHAAATHPAVTKTKRKRSGFAIHAARPQGVHHDTAQRDEAMVEVARRIATTHAEETP